MEAVEMFPFFHIAIPLLVFEIPYIKKKYQANRIALLIGSIFPDLVDKVLAFLKLSNGRGFFHTLLFITICFFIVYLFSWGNKSISVPFFIGMLFHILIDLPYVPLFYPFIMYDFTYQGDPNWLYTLLTSPVVQITEIIGILIISFIIIKNKLFKRNQLKEFLIPSIITFQIPNPENIVVED
jgi:membrane-bound metal-dependent hydrolase YbcI (DUF457 family)